VAHAHVSTKHLSLIVSAEQWWPGNVASVNMAERKVLLIYETSAPPAVLQRLACHANSSIWVVLEVIGT